MEEMMAIDHFAQLLIESPFSSGSLRTLSAKQLGERNIQIRV